MKIYIPSYKRPDTELIKWAVGKTNVFVCLNSNDDTEYPAGLNLIRGGVSLSYNRNACNKHFLDNTSDPHDIMFQIDDNYILFEVYDPARGREYKVDIDTFMTELEKDAILAQNCGYDLFTPKYPGFLHLWYEKQEKPISPEKFFQRCVVGDGKFLASRRAVEAIGDFEIDFWENNDWWLRGRIKGFMGALTKRVLCSKGPDTKYKSYIYGDGVLPGEAKTKRMLWLGERFAAKWPGLRVGRNDWPGYPNFTVKQMDEWVEHKKIKGFFNL